MPHIIDFAIIPDLCLLSWIKFPSSRMESNAIFIINSCLPGILCLNNLLNIASHIIIINHTIKSQYFAT